MPDDIASDLPSHLLLPPGASSVLPDVPDEPGPGVLLLHGHPGPSLIWKKLQQRLCGHGMRVLVPDRLGDSGTALDHFDAAAALARLVDEQGHSPVVVVGHSAGARAALTLAADAPHHVRALVLLAPADGPAAITATDRLLAAPVLGPTLSWLGFRAAGLLLRVPRVRQHLLTERAGLSVADAKEVARLVAHGTAWRRFTIEQRQLVIDAHRAQQELRNVHCPVVIVAGRHDRVADPDAVGELVRRLPESIVVTADAGHLIPFDEPDVVVDAVLRALRLEYQQSLSRRRVKPARECATGTS
jgi:pimeloyl-ACP methyl ester carboxylesterase